MAIAGILSAAAGVIPGGSVVTSAAGGLSGISSIVSIVDPGKARDAARINRRDFFLNAGKAGSVLATQYLLAGEANVYTDKEKGQYRDGVNEMATKAPETLALARARGAKWDADVGAANLLPVGQLIAQELGQRLNVPADVQNVNQVGAIQAWASQFGYAIRRDAAQSIGQLAAGVGSAAASAVAPPGSAQKGSVLVPTTKTALVIGGLLVAGLAFYAFRKR